jgi:hypothetical protein
MVDSDEEEGRCDGRCKATGPQRAGDFVAWSFAVGLVWVLFLGLYALTQWTVRSF